jgi:LytTr DNA-binding domain-containing protein
MPNLLIHNHLEFFVFKIFLFPLVLFVFSNVFIGGATAPEGLPMPNMFARINNRYQRIDLNDILYIESARNYCKIICKSGTIQMVLTTMTHLADLLPENQFLRIQRSYIVALDKITSFDNHTVTIGSKVLPVGESYQDVLRQHVIIIDMPQQKARQSLALV